MHGVYELTSAEHGTQTVNTSVGVPAAENAVLKRFRNFNQGKRLNWLYQQQGTLIWELSVAKSASEGFVRPKPASFTNRNHLNHNIVTF
jgi:hypothetical protein